MSKSAGSQSSNQAGSSENGPEENEQSSIKPLPVDSALLQRIKDAIGPVLPSGQRGQVLERVSRVIAAEIFRGPLPHPKHLQHYEEIFPGLADRIVQMAEKAQNREEDRLDDVVRLEYQDRRLGMHLGFWALVCLIGAGTLISLLGNVYVGGGLLTAAVIGAVAGTFVHGRNNSFAQQVDSDGDLSTDQNKKKSHHRAGN